MCVSLNCPFFKICFDVNHPDESHVFEDSFKCATDSVYKRHQLHTQMSGKYQSIVKIKMYNIFIHLPC